MTKLAEAFPTRSGGYWGRDPGTSEIDAKAIRNGDVGTSGVLRWDALPLRAYTSREFAKAQIHAGDIVLTTSGNCGNAAFIGTEPAEPTVATNFVRILRVDPERADPRYAFHFLRTGSFSSGIAPFARGATIKNLSVETAFTAVDIPLPSIPEQRRIAAILDHADALRAKRRQVLTHLDSLIRSTFKDMFPSEDGERVPIGAFAEVRTGSTPPRSDSSNFGGKIPWVKTTEVQGGLIKATSEHVTEQGVTKARLKLFPVGSVVVAMYGQGKTRGQSAILGIPATTNQACAVIVPNDAFVPEFLQAQLSISYDRLRGEAEGGNQPNLSINRVAAFDVVLPPLAAQREFADRKALIAQQIGTTASAHDVDDELFASLQSRAFRGEL